MDIVVPLRIVGAVQKLRIVSVVLQHEMDVAVPTGTGAQFRSQLEEPVAIRQRVHGIEAQPVEAEFVEPVERVFREEAAHLRHAKSDGAAPWRLDRVVEELRRVERKPVPVRSEMIVDDVEEHHQTQLVRPIDQSFQFVGRAVGAVRRKGKNAVIAPAMRAGKFRDRHQLDGGDAKPGEPRQLCRDPVEAAEQARMQLVEHRVLPGPAIPAAGAPRIGAGIA